MAAHVPRRVFAPSFVITVAALPLGCDQKPTPNTPAPDPIPSATAADSASAPPTASATATATATAAPDETWNVAMLQPGQCQAMSPPPTCPPNAMCNPPPPQTYPCPKGVPQDAYPLTVTKAAGALVCTASYMIFSGGGNCPHGMHCNPPPPQHKTVNVPCPP